MANDMNGVPVLKCSFEYNKIKNINDYDLDGNIKTEWQNLDFYNLYIFCKKGSSYMLCWNKNEEPAKPLDFYLSTGRVLCDFSFKRGRRYFLYFSSKKLSNLEINQLSNGSGKQFIEIIANKQGRIKFNHSFFIWKYMVLPIAEQSPRIIDLINKVIDIYELGEDELDIENVDKINIKWIRENRFLILPDERVFDVYYLLSAIKLYVEEKKIKWNELLKEIDSTTSDFYENRENLGIAQLYSYDDIWTKFKNEIVSSINMIGAIYGSIIAKKSFEMLTSQTGKALFEILDEFFNTIDAALEIFNEDIRYAENGVVVEKYKNGKIKNIIETTTGGFCYTNRFDKNENKVYVLEEKICDEERIKIKETFIKNGQYQKINYYDQYGIDVVKTEHCNYNNSSEEFELISTDQWMINSSGHVIKDFKQFTPDVVGIILNNNRKRISYLNAEETIIDDVTNPLNYFEHSGNLLTSIAIVDSFYKNENGYSSITLEAFIDSNNLWISNDAADIDFDDVVSRLNYVSDSLQGSVAVLKEQINLNLENNIPTFIRIQRPGEIGGHTAVIGGTRKDFNGNVIKYLVRDPGSNNEQRKYMDFNTLSNGRGEITNISWVTKSQL